MDNNIEVVIKIPKSMKDMCEWHQDGICDLVDIETDILAEAIKNGTVLPKGHGRLIDADELIKELKDHKYSNTFCLEHNIDWSIDLGMAILLTNDAQTMVKADKEVN